MNRTFHRPSSITCTSVLLTMIFLTSGCPMVSSEQSTFIQREDGGQKLVALTFDDGPYGNVTNEILDILKEKNVQSTFFIIGKNAEEYPDILKRESSEGHLIGNHSFNHSKYLRLLDRNALLKNLKAADTSIAETAGVHPRFFRPPYGFESPWMVKEIEKAGYVIILWNDATEDYYMKESPKHIESSILKKLKPGAIIDLHDGRDIRQDYPRENLIKALPSIIDKIREKGYTLVTLDKIIKQQPYF